MLDNGANIHHEDKKDRTALLWAVHNGHASVVRLLLTRGARKNQIAKFGVTPLIAAADEGREECVRILLEAGADATPRMRYSRNFPTLGPRAIDVAKWRGHKTIVSLLRTYGSPGLSLVHLLNGSQFFYGTLEHQTPRGVFRD